MTTTDHAPETRAHSASPKVVTTIQRRYPESQRSRIIYTISMQYAMSLSTVKLMLEKSATAFERVIPSKAVARKAPLVLVAAATVGVMALVVGAVLGHVSAAKAFFAALLFLGCVIAYVTTFCARPSHESIAAALSGVSTYDISTMRLSSKTTTADITRDLTALANKMTPMPSNGNSWSSPTAEKMVQLSDELVTMLSSDTVDTALRRDGYRTNEKLAESLLLLSSMVNHVNTVRLKSLCDSAVEESSHTPLHSTPSMDEAMRALTALEADIITMLA